MSVGDMLPRGSYQYLLKEEHRTRMAQEHMEETSFRGATMARATGVEL